TCGFEIFIFCRNSSAAYILVINPWIAQYKHGSFSYLSGGHDHIATFFKRCFGWLRHGKGDQFFYKNFLYVFKDRVPGGNDESTLLKLIVLYHVTVLAGERYPECFCQFIKVIDRAVGCIVSQQQ